jgi:hypothetical protein
MPKFPTFVGILGVTVEVWGHLRKVLKKDVAELVLSLITRILQNVPGSVDAATGHYIRKLGRPRNEWAVMLKKECYRMSPQFESIISNCQEWKRAVYKYCI